MQVFIVFIKMFLKFIVLNDKVSVF